MTKNARNNRPISVVKVETKLPKRRNPKRKSSVKAKPRVQVRIKKSVISTKPRTQTRKQPQSMLRNNNRAAAHALQPYAPSGRERGIALSAMLPYEGPMLRVRPGSVSSVPLPSAVTRHYENIDINVADLMGRGVVVPTPTPPICGSIDATTKVFQDLNTSFPIISVLDPYLLAIVPSRFLRPGDTPAATRLAYEASSFMNANQFSQGNFKFELLSNPQVAPAESTITVVSETVLWLDPVEFVGFSGDTENAYGSVHPCFDADNGTNLGRYIWIDANIASDPMDINNCTYIQVICDLPAGFVNVLQADGSSSLKIVVERLADETTSAAESFYSYFEQAIGPKIDMFATRTLTRSGYYRVGLTGWVQNDTAPPQPLVLQSMKVRIWTDPVLNVVAKHITNTNVFASEGIKTFFDTVQVFSGSMLVRNTTPKLTLGGMCYAYAASSEDAWYKYTSRYETIRSPNPASNGTLKYTGDLSKGAYGWLRNNYTGFRTFTDSRSYIAGGTVSCIRSYSISRRGNINDRKFNAMNAFLLTPPDTLFAGQGNPVAALTISLITCVQFEYTTLNQTPYVISTAMTADDYNKALLLLQHAPTFTENPLHVQSMLAAVSQLANRVVETYRSNRKAIRPIYAALSSFGPIAGALGQAALGLDSAIFEN